MFFTFFMKPAPPGETAVRSDVLFFFRARASVDYAMTDTSNLPQFGLTSAVSYKSAGLERTGAGPRRPDVQPRMFAKAGVQFARTGRRATVFSWLVCEADRQPVVDVFILGRYVHPLKGATGLFLQESRSTPFLRPPPNNTASRSGACRRPGAPVAVRPRSRHHPNRQGDVRNDDQHRGFVRYEF